MIWGYKLGFEPPGLFVATGSLQAMMSHYERFYKQKVIWFRHYRTITLIC